MSAPQWKASQLAGKTALVTGASGFIGAAVSRRLQAAGAIVHGTSRTPRSGGSCAQWWQADLSDFDEVCRLLDNVAPDLVVHLSSLVTGARDVDLVLPTMRANLVAAVNVLTATAKSCRVRVLFAGSQEETASDGTWPVPCSPYAAAKLAAGAYARMFHALFHSPVVWLRLHMVYGPGQRDTRKLVPYVTRSLLRGEAPCLSSGERRIDWVFVDDVADAFLASAVASGVDGRTIDIGSGQLVSVKTVAEKLAQIIGTNIAPRFGALRDRPLEVEAIADTEDATECLDWRPQTCLDDGLCQTVNWYRRHSDALSEAL